jgi:arylsulfotransferase ASST
VRLLPMLLAGALALSTLPPPAALAWPSPHTLGSYAYVSPAPGSALQLQTTNIIVRPGGMVDPVSVQPGIIQAVGSQSGLHDGSTRLSDDGRTIVFKPGGFFYHGETVTCTIAAGLRSTPGDDLPEASFSFTIVDDPPGSPPLWRSGLEELLAEVATVPRSGLARAPVAQGRSVVATDTLPADLPPAAVLQGGPTASGDLFLSAIRFDDPAYQSYLMIVANDGTPRFYRKLTGSGFDFKVQEPGRITYFDAAASAYYAMNARCAVVDSFQAGNGYLTDVHELQLLPNGHALLMSYDAHVVDMSAVVEGGNPSAVVSGLVIQELDRAKDVVFQWRSWDHFQITDTVRPLTAPTIDYAHGNAIEPDADGNLLISSRHMNEITKISREDGHIIWRWGGKNNEFTFVNDPDGFNHQHSVRRIANGHVMLFDNGDFHDPPYSRAVEYALDETAKTATLVWQYRNSPEAYGFAMGSVQRLANGNTVIGWGSTSPALTEVTPQGTKVEELALPNGVYSYRAFRHDWPPIIATSLVLEPGRVDAGTPPAEVTVWIRPENELFFPTDSIDASSVRLHGAIPATSVGPVDPTRGLELRFPLASLLAYLHPGRQPVEVTGSLVSGERFRAQATLEIVGEKQVRARMASAVGAWPLRIAFRADGTNPRSVTMVAYDATGRRVRRWTATIDGAGEMIWDGRGGNGERMASGIYFVGTEGSAIDEMARVVLVK